MATNHTYVAAVERQVEVIDTLRVEIADLFSQRAIERLQPEIVSILVVAEKDKPPLCRRVQGEAVPDRLLRR